MGRLDRLESQRPDRLARNLAVLGWSHQAQAERSDVAGRVMEPSAGGGLRALVARRAQENGIPVALANAVVQIESGFNPRARNRSGAMGLMQIKTQTARGQGYAGSASGLLNPDTNLRFAMRYLATAYRMSGGDVCGTVMRYQSGHFARRMSSADRSYCSKARHLMAQA
jgi:soluble lytic murein transglycosylase-like protein